MPLNYQKRPNDAERARFNMLNMAIRFQRLHGCETSHHLGLKQHAVKKFLQQIIKWLRANGCRSFKSERMISCINR